MAVDSSEICGEVNPGFNLWTSAHGFHHISLTRSKGWKLFWILIVLILSLALIAVIIYYFYYVFSFSVYSRFMLESPPITYWPTTILCDRRAFASYKMSAVTQMSTTVASILSWSLSPYLTRPEILNTQQYQQVSTQLNDILQRFEYNNDVTKLMQAISPTCTQLILECTLANVRYNGSDCCREVFNPVPIFTRYGTCYSTHGAIRRAQVKMAGEGSGLNVITMHDRGNVYDPTLAHSDIYSASGLAYAVADDYVTVSGAMRTKGQNIASGSFGSVGITKMVIDNSELRYSPIANLRCLPPGIIDTWYLDAELLLGVGDGYGYTKEACQGDAKRDLLAREMFGCSFNPFSNETVYRRCRPYESTQFYTSQISSNTSNSLMNNPNLKRRYDIPCPTDCVQERYTLTASYSTLTDLQRQDLQAKLQALQSTNNNQFGGGNVDFILLKLYLNSLEYEKIYNAPQSGLQFVAEIGGLCAFFLGISMISIIECLCYCCGCKCCGTEEDMPDELRQKARY